MLANSSSPEDKSIHNKQNLNIESSNDSNVNRESSLLPRSAWNSDLAFLRVIFKAKKTLDEIESAE